MQVKGIHKNSTGRRELGHQTRIVHDSEMEKQKRRKRTSRDPVFRLAVVVGLFWCGRSGRRPGCDRAAAEKPKIIDFSCCCNWSARYMSG